MFLLSTVSQNVILSDLGLKTIIHPVVDLDLESIYGLTENELINSNDLINNLNNNLITIKSNSKLLKNKTINNINIIQDEHEHYLDNVLINYHFILNSHIQIS